jgi:hypothetical protein
MTFDEKFLNCTQYFANHTAPTYVRSDIDLFADFVELTSIFSKDDEMSIGVIQDRFFGTKDYSSAHERDNDDNLVISIFLRLQERSFFYNDGYPFIFDNDKTILKNKSSLAAKQHFYIYLLISSKLNIFSAFQKELTTEFEVVCKEVLEKYLPSSAIVKNFGKKTDYKGSAADKIRELN